MDYQTQLSQDQWREKRKEILKRDNCECTSCGKKRSDFRHIARFKELPGEPEIIDRKSLKSIGLSFAVVNDNYDDKLLTAKHFGGKIAKYIGDKNRPFVIDELRFCQKFLSEKKNDKKEYPSVFFFYQDTFEGQDRVDLNVHHKYYITGRMAWEYDNDALILLCSDCHKKLHQEQTIYVYSPIKVQGEDWKVSHATQICITCEGAGIRPEYHYHLDGICFNCKGEGVVGI